MNWETTKTWLVVTFLALDLLLGWQLLQSRREMQSYTEPYSDIVANTKTLLADHGFTLNASIPQSQPSLSTLKADFAAPSLGHLARVAFPHATDVQLNMSAATASGSEGVVRLTGNGSWIVTYATPVKPSGKSLSTLLPYVWHGSSYTPDADASVPGTGTEMFAETWQSEPIFDAEVQIQLTNGAMTSYSQTAIVNMVPVSSAKPVISALDALDNLANSMDKLAGSQDNKITSVDLGYAEKTSPDAAEQPANYWFPVWRVITAGSVYYINALTGEVENPVD